MSFLEKYACFYGDEKFTEEEQAEIGRFAARLMKVASTGDEMEIARVFRSEFGDMDEETFDRVDRYFEFLYHYGEGLSKEAQRIPIESVLSALALGLAATPLAERIIGKISKNAALKASLKKILQDHPELRDDPRTPEYFQAIADFAPDIAKNPILAGNVMQQMHRIGPAHLTPQLLHTLVEIQAGIPKGVGLGTMAEPIREFAGEIRAHKEMLAGQGGRRYGQQRFWSGQQER